MTIDPTLPDPVRRLLEAGARLEAIHLDEEGVWHHEGEPIRHERLRQLFHRSIARTPGGTWVLSIPPFTYPITVADTPYHVRSLRLLGEQIILRLSDGTEEVLEPAGLRHVPDRGLYCAVKGGRFQARFNRPAFYALAERLEPLDEPAGRYALRLGGRLYELT